MEKMMMVEKKVIEVIQSGLSKLQNIVYKHKKKFICRVGKNDCKNNCGIDGSDKDFCKECENLLNLAEDHSESFRCDIDDSFELLNTPYRIRKWYYEEIG